MSLKLELGTAQERANATEESRESLKKQLSSKEEALESATANLRDVEVAHARDKERWEKELGAQVKISNLYKKNVDDAQKSIVDKEEELKAATKQATDEMKLLQSRLNKQRDEAEKALASYKKEMDTTITSLKAELEAKEKDSQDKGEQGRLRLTGPAADALPPVVPDAQLAIAGLSLSETQDRLVQAEQALHSEKSERKKLELYLNHLLKELDRKGPIIASQKQDYRRALQSHEQLSR
ncbi:unnamed protein product, partial [Chrysoparadoxa australica]